MSTLFAYLNTHPSLDEIQQILNNMGFNYKHSLPPDGRWDYPMHVFGQSDIRLVYHEGDPEQGEAVVDTTMRSDSPSDMARLHVVLRVLIGRYGGTILDTHNARRGLN